MESPTGVAPTKMPGRFGHTSMPGRCACGLPIGSENWGRLITPKPSTTPKSATLDDWGLLANMEGL